MILDRNLLQLIGVGSLWAKEEVEEREFKNSAQLATRLQGGPAASHKH